MSHRAASLSVAILAAFLALAWTAANVYCVDQGHWTALFCIGQQSSVPPDLAASTWRVPSAYGYDGQFYRSMAHDPFLRKDYAPYMDVPQLRFRRILVPLLAWLVALTQSRWIDGAYIAIEIFSLALGVYWCSRWFALRGRSPFLGLLFIALPATLASLDRMLLDGPLAACFAGFMLYSEEKRWNRVWLLAMLAALTRETGLVLVAGAVAWCCLRRDWRSSARFALAALPALAWFTYVAVRVPHEHPDPVTIPLWGILRRLFVFRSFPDPRVQFLVRVTDILAVLGLLVSIGIALQWIRRRPQTPVTLAVALFAVLALSLGSVAYMEEAFGFGRLVSPLLLWIMLESLAAARWVALIPPLLISLSVSQTFAHPLLAIARAALRR